MTDMTVIDADGHILEQEDQLARYLDWPYREPGEGWTSYPRDGWNRRLGGRLGQWADSAESWLKKSPGEYIRSGLIYFSCEADEPVLPEALRLVGEDAVVYASDYPHWDNEFPGSIRVLKGREDITDAQRRKILADNARRLYRGLGASA